MSDENLTAEIDREIRTSDKIDRNQVREVIQGAPEIMVTLEINSSCKSLDSYKETLPRENQSIFPGTEIYGESVSNNGEEFYSIAQDVAAVADLSEIGSISKLIPGEANLHENEKVAVTIENLNDMIVHDLSDKMESVCEIVYLTDAISGLEVDMGSACIHAIVSTLVSGAANSNILSDQIRHNGTMTVTAGVDTDILLDTIPLESTKTPAAITSNDELLDAVAPRLTINPPFEANTDISLQDIDFDLTMTPAAGADTDMLSDTILNLLPTNPAAGSNADVLHDAKVLKAITVDDDEEMIELKILMNDTETIDMVRDIDYDLSVKEVGIKPVVDIGNGMTTGYVEIEAEHPDDLNDATVVDLSRAEVVLDTTIRQDTFFTTVDSEIPVNLAPTKLLAGHFDMGLGGQIETVATNIDVTLAVDSSTLPDSIDIDRANNNLGASYQATILSTCYEVDDSELLSESTADIRVAEKSDLGEATLSDVEAPDVDEVETVPPKIELPVELLSSCAPADTAECSGQVLVGDERIDNIMIISNEDTSNISFSIASVEQINVAVSNDNGKSEIFLPSIICPSIESVYNLDINLSENQGEERGEEREVTDSAIVHKIDDHMGYHDIIYNSVLMHAVDQIPSEGANVEYVPSDTPDENSRNPCAQDSDSYQNDDLLKVDTFAKRLDYLNSVDKLNSPKKNHDDDVLDGEAVNEIVVIKESVVITENIIIQENVYIKESIVIKECITMETTKALYRPASLIRSDKTASPFSEKAMDNFLNDDKVLLECDPVVIEGPVAAQSTITINEVEISGSSKLENSLDDGEKRILDDHVEDEVLGADKCVKSKVSLFTRLFGKKEIPPVEKTFVPICCSGVLSASTCYRTSAEEKVAVKCDKDADKPTMDMITTEDSDEGFLDA